jgi:hypothetical protein
MRLAGHVARRGRKGMHIGYWWEVRRKQTTGRPRRRWVGNIKMDLREMGWGGTDLIDLAQDGDQ